MCSMQDCKQFQTGNEMFKTFELISFKITEIKRFFMQFGKRKKFKKIVSDPLRE